MTPIDVDACAVDTPSDFAEPTIQLYLLGSTRVTLVSDRVQQDLKVQAKPLRLLAYLALKGNQPHRREELQALFWPAKSARSAANNLRQSLPPATLAIQGERVVCNPAASLRVDALAFEVALDAEDINTALDLW